MALEHTLKIATKLSPEQILDLLVEGDTFKLFAKRLSERQARVSTNDFGFFVYVGAMDTHDKKLFRELGIEPDITIIFLVDSSKDAEVTAQKLLSAVLELLRQEPGDAVLLLTGEFVWLLRRSGKLILGERDSLWTPANLKLLDVPYTVEEFPVM